ncbi:MAG: hypothetical protein KME06_10665 [Kastovskya adunca ATA6-11-RM4]|jgi:tRNA(fMet)-specific endonuclease VapC|nr:hypothetical protein [Kastovskya adunca ATA6-11-RM4]
MRYLLDTNVCVMYLNGRSVSVRDRLHSISLEEMAVCSIVRCQATTQLELWNGNRNF